MSTAKNTPFRPFPFLERSISINQKTDGSLYLRSKIPLAQSAPHIPSLLAAGARMHPNRIWLAQRRGPQHKWVSLTYGQGKQQVDNVTQALLDLQRPDTTVVMLSENSLEHAVLQLAAMQARMPFVAITPAYSLLTKDFTKLRDMVRLVDPAVVFVQDGARFKAALEALQLEANTTVCAVDHATASPGIVDWQSWATVEPGIAVQEAVDGISHGTVAKYLFSSGSTGTPKAITMTQGMLTACVAMHGQTGSRDLIDPPVILSWLPWSHVAGGNSILHNTLAAGGSLFIDGGKPVPGGFAETLTNLREISPTQFSSVPSGYTMLVEALSTDQALARNFFSQLRTISFSGAGMPEFVHERLQDLAVEHTGYRIPVVSGWGMTESSSGGTYVYWNSETVGIIGLPQPGIELKLIPLEEGRYEARMRGPCVTPGYLRQPQLTAEAFDEEGYYKTGDAVQFVDPERPNEGLSFAGRVAEEFKLQTGTFVRVGRLRVLALESADGLLSDAVVTGADEPFVGLMAWLNVERCREFCGEPEANAAQLARCVRLRQALRAAIATHNARHPASSLRIQRVLLLDEPPSMTAGEITDKGYVNQRAVLKRRNHLAKLIYTNPVTPDVIEIT